MEDQEGVEFFGCTDEKLFGPDVDLMEASTQAGFSLIMNFKNALYGISYTRTLSGFIDSLSKARL